MKNLKNFLILFFLLAFARQTYSFQLTPADATVLFKERKIFIRTETSIWEIEYRDTKRITIMTRKGTELSDITIPYKRGVKAEFIEGKTIRPDGSEIILYPDENVDEKLLFPQYPEREYMKELVIHFPQVEPGCIIEYTIKRTSETIYFMEPYYFQEQLYVNETALNFDVTMGFEYTYLPLNIGTREFSLENAKWDLAAAVRDLEWNAQRYRWQYSNIEPLLIEPNMPPKKELAFGCYFVLTYYKHDPLDFSIHEDWKDVSENLKKIYDDILKKNKNAKNVAKEITNGIKEKKDRVKAIYEYIQSNINHIPVNGIQPGPLTVDEVLEAKTADNMEANFLFVAMLDEADIDAYPALVATKDFGIVYPQFESPDQFNKIITYIPKIEEGVWLDASSEFAKFPALPPNCEGVNALPIGLKKDELLTTPITGLRQNLINKSTQIAVTDEGFLNGNARCTYYAHNEYKIRKIFSGMNAEQRKIYIETNLQKAIPEATITNLTVTELKDLSIPFQISYSFETGKSLLNENNEIEFNPAIFNYDFHNDVKEESRMYPFFLDFPRTQMISASITLPENSEIVSTPKSVVNRQFFGEFIKMAEQVGTGLSYQERMSLKQDKYEVEEYKLLRDFSNQLINSKKENITVKLK